MNTAPKTKEKIYLSGLISLYWEPLRLTYHATYNKHALLERVSPVVVSFNTVSVSFTNLTHDRVSQLTKLLLELGHLNTYEGFRRLLVRSNLNNRRGSGGRVGTMLTQLQSLKSQRRRQKAGSRRSRTKS